MKFIDYAKIYIQSGHGGKGCVSFRREKFVPRGGPDGGDGGKGGDVIFIASSDMNTLLDFRYKKEYRAKNGGNGRGKNMHGQNGKDLEIPVPVGTIIRNDGSGEIEADLMKAGESFTVARGGRGGLGNMHFATATRQVPRFAQPGEEGEEKYLVLELKLLADVGLIGLPNAGKSTLISVISAARPKVADYPFTTLVPNLGVVNAGVQRNFVVADIPGLIEGAHRGAGLGTQFLRHIERTRILLHLVDVADEVQGRAVDQYQRIHNELAQYSRDLLKKKIVVVATKIDILNDDGNVGELENYCRKHKIKFLKISAVTRKGISDLVKYLAGELEKQDETHSN